MKWASAISRNSSFEGAVSECAESIARDLGPGETSLVFAFATPHFAARYDDFYDLVARVISPEVLIGCSGGGVIGGDEEVERAPAISLVAARLSEVRVSPFHLEGDSLPDLDGPPDVWENLVGVEPDEDPQFILLTEPFSIRTETLISGLDYAFPDSPKIGGLASGGGSPGLNTLFLDGEVFTEGAVGVALSGDVLIETVVAQGCRPIGDLLNVTACEGNWLRELDGNPAFEAAQEIFANLGERDRVLARSALFVGVLMDEFTPEPKAGDFLIRNVVGADPARGAIAVGENLQPGMRLRFHVRDAETSAEDLHTMLENHASDAAATRGALLFSCLGRGENLYGKPNFDTGIFQQHAAGVPVGGFFCNGEIGPVGASTFLHGYTSSLALFKPRNPRP